MLDVDLGKFRFAFFYIAVVDVVEVSFFEVEV